MNPERAVTLTGKTALVTGGRQGIGRAISDSLLTAGARVMSCGRGRRPADLPREILWQSCDVSSGQSVNELAEGVREHLGPLSILVNNAGVQLEKTLPDTTDEDYERLMGVNVRGVFLMCRRFLSEMPDGSAIVNLGSISATAADPGLALYNASKAFVAGLSRSIAVDHGPRIRCNAVCPGWIMTSMADAAFAVADNVDAAKHDALARHPAGRFGKPEDVAALVCWLVSDQAAFATGQCYTIDGGLTAQSPLKPDLF